MDTTRRADDAVVASLRDHVLTPLETATEAIEQEYEEVRAECRAFEEFKGRVAAVETTSQSPTAPRPRSYTREARPRAAERLRSAFRETVMSVDHYEKTYGESLGEHVSAELSADVATVFREDSPTPFSELGKTALTAATESAFEQRERFLAVLDAEQRSVEAARETLSELVDTYGRPNGSGVGRGDAAARLDDLAETRQETVQSRNPMSRTDGHDLCSYLYRDADWTYPVLTAVARFRQSTV